MPMVSAAIATAMITNTHHLDTALAAAAESPVLGIPARAITATGGGATIKAKASMKANGITPGIAATTTATRARANTPILSDWAVL